MSRVDADEFVMTWGVLTRLHAYTCAAALEIVTRTTPEMLTGLVLHAFEARTVGAFDE
jgi:hypothetical protein